MAEADNVLGISGQMDISDIQSTIDKLCSTLQRIGVETDALSERMTKALNDIAKSDGDISTKTQQSMSVLKEAMDEAKKGMEDVPSMIKIAQQHVDDYQSSISKLNAELANTPQSSSTYEEITKQLEAQQTALKLAQEDVNDLTQAYSNASDVMGKANSVYEALNTATIASSATGQAQAVTNVEVGASATAAATATGAEAAAHISNAVAATTNAQAENANVEATKNLTSSLQEYISVASGRAEIERMQSENSKELRNDIKMYEQSIKDIQATLDSTDFSKKISDATAAIEKQQGKIETYKEALANLSPEDNATGQGTNYYNSLIEQSQQKIAELQEQIEGWQQQQQTLNADLEEYNTLLDAAKQIQGGETIIPTEQQTEKFSVDVDSSSLQDLRTQLDDSKSKLQDLEAEADKFNGKPLGDSQKQKLDDLNKEIDDTKEKISVLQDAIKQKNEETFVGSLRNQLSELKEKVSEFGSELKDKITAPFTELGNKISNSGFGQRFSAEFSQVKAGMEDFKNGAINVITANGKLQENVGNLTKAIGGLGIPLGGALTGIKAVTKALWGMCATPIGAVIAAIVLGLKAVQTWMTKSAEGQKVYTKLMAFFGSLMSTITDIVVTFGSFLYHCFADANGPLRDFGNNLIKTFTSAGKAVFGIIGGIGTALKGIFTLNWDTFSNGLEKIWDGIKNAGSTVINAVKTQITGVVGVFGAVKDFFAGGTFDKMSSQLTSGLSTARKMADLAGKQQEAEIAISESKKTQAELDIKIAENREKIYQLTGKEKLALIEETKELQRQKYDGILNAQKKMLSYQQQRMKLHTNSLQDIAKERELSVDILRTEAQRAASTRMLTRQEEAAKRSMESQAKSAEKAAAAEAKREFKQNEATKSAQGKYDETLYNNDQAREKVITDLETKVADARIAAMKEGFTKTQAERKREQKKELKDLQVAEENAIDAERKRQKTEFDARNAIRKAQGKSTLVWNDDTDFQETDDVKSIRQMYATLQQLTVNRQVEDEKKAADQLIEAHQSYRDKLISIDKKYQEDLQAVDTAIAEAQKRGDTAQVEALERTRDKRTAEHGKEKLQASFDELKNSPEYSVAYDDLDKASTETIQNLIKRFEEVKDASASAFDPEGVKTYFDTLNKMIDELIDRDPIGMLSQLTEQLSDARSEMESNEDELENTKNILDSIKGGTKVPTNIRYDANTGKLIVQYLSLADAEKKVAEAENKLSASRVKVNKLSSEVSKAQKKILDQVKELGTQISNLGNVMGGEAGEILNLLGSIVTFVSTSAQSITLLSKTGAEAIKGIERASVILGIISAALQLLQALSKFYKDSYAQYEAYAEKIKEINKLTEAVNDYKLAVTKAREEEKNWFANTTYSNLASQAKISGQALNSYIDKLGEAQAIYQNQSGGGWLTNAIKVLTKFGGDLVSLPSKLISKGLDKLGLLGDNTVLSKILNYGVTGAFFGYEGMLAKGLADIIPSNNYQEGTTAAINNLRIETRKKSSGFLGTGIGSKSQKTEDLRTWAKNNLGEDLFDESGMLNIELADTILKDYGDKLVGETKDTLEKLKELSEEYKKYREEVEKSISDEYSPLVDNMTDALFDWLSNGKDVMDSFKDYANDTFAEIAKDMVKQMVLTTLFEPLKKQLANLYEVWGISQNENNPADRMSLSSLLNGILMAVDSFMSDATEKMPELENFVEQLNESFSKRGFDITGNQEQEATSKGVSSITYDQANLLVNLATARNIALEQGNQVRQLMQIDVSQLRIATMQIQTDISVMRDIQEQGLTQLTRIEVNTRPISEILSTLQEMYRIQKENA